MTDDFIDLVLDDGREEEAHEILDAIGVFVKQHDVDCNVLRVHDDDRLLVEEVMEEHGFLYEWDYEWDC